MWTLLFLSLMILCLTLSFIIHPTIKGVCQISITHTNTALCVHCIIRGVMLTSCSFAVEAFWQILKRVKGSLSNSIWLLIDRWKQRGRDRESETLAFGVTANSKRVEKTTGWSAPTTSTHTHAHTLSHIKETTSACEHLTGSAGTEKMWSRSLLSHH